MTALQQHPTRRRRRRGLLLGTVGLAVILAAAVGQHGAMESEALPEGIQWKQTFTDDFSGRSLDRSKWTPSRYGENANEAPYNPDKEAGYYTESGVTVSHGSAQLTIRPADPWVLINGQLYGWSSGVITTRGKFALRPGDFVQARLWVPRGSGLWPAFWGIPEKGTWPPEMDFFEFFDTSIDARPYLSYLNEDDQWDGPTAYGDAATDYRDSWHVYGLHWQTDGSIVPYIDGVARPEVRKKVDTTQPMFIVLNLALQKGHTPPDGAQFRADWVRAYEAE